MVCRFGSRVVVFAAVAAASLFVTGAVGYAAETVVLGDDDSLLTGIPGKGAVTEDQLQKWLDNDANHAELEIKLPKGLDAAKANIFVPEDNPMTRAKIELGRQLYFDPRLSSDGTISCASCHHPDKGYGFDTQFGVGVGGQQGGRNSPVAYNRIVSKAQFWDGRAGSLEDQAVGPIANAIEMGNTHEACVATITEIPGYEQQFTKIFDDGINIDNVGKAIAAFERAIVTGPTPYDYYQPIEQFEKTFDDIMDELDDEPELKEKYDELKKAAAEHPMSESAVRGMKLFAKKARCAECHAGANFTDEQYHNLGVGMDAEKPDLGRFDVTKDPKDKGAFKTPTLRNVALSPPYMHDGSQKTLEEVVEWYNKGGHKNPWLSDKMKPLELTEQEKKDVVAFMKEGLTGEFPKVESGRLPSDAKKKTDKKSDGKKMAKDAGRGFLGVTCNASDVKVARVARVLPGSAAEAAGVQIGDVVVKVNGQKVTTYADLRAALKDSREGEQVKLRVKRGDEAKTLSATLGTLSAEK
ncbi:MAG: PDZ domain-containing protein [Pirellulaceae bacterium]|nr:PDZ domain-containing protein [Pirellulaceae bacterium]